MSRYVFYVCLLLNGAWLVPAQAAFIYQSVDTGRGVLHTAYQQNGQIAGTAAVASGGDYLYLYQVEFTGAVSGLELDTLDFSTSGLVTGKHLLSGGTVGDGTTATTFQSNILGPEPQISAISTAAGAKRTAILFLISSLGPQWIGATSYAPAGLAVPFVSYSTVGPGIAAVPVPPAAFLLLAGVPFATWLKRRKLRA